MVSGTGRFTGSISMILLGGPMSTIATLLRWEHGSALEGYTDPDGAAREGRGSGSPIRLA